MKLPTLNEQSVGGNRVLVRLDTDVPLEDGKVVDDFRLRVALPTIEFLLSKDVRQIIILGKLGRPKGEDESLSLRPVVKHLEKLIGEKIALVNVPEVSKVPNVAKKKIVMLENLRFWEGEEKNDPEFAKKLANLGDFYVNESFADSHREHTSIVGLPKLLPHAAGLRFIQEVENLSKVLDNPQNPVVFIIGGAKSDKVNSIDKLLDHGDWVLVGGLLPRIVSSYCRDDNKTCVSAAHLMPGGYDIDEASATNFAAIAANARTIVWNGPLGKYEDMEYRNGTEIVARAVVANDDAFKVVGGGDTVAVLQTLGILSKMNWVSTGGGSMLEYLAYGDLPGLKALRM